MAKISTYDLDGSITGNDILLGSSAEGSFNGNTTYVTRNFKLSELASFFKAYDPDTGTGGGDLTALTNRVTALENAGFLTEHPNIPAASSVDNSGQFFIQDITLDSNGHIISITSAEASGGGGGITNETDPVYSASPAAGISSSNITNWNTAYGWGDHSTQNYLTTETDPTVPSHVKGITVTEVANWNTAYTWGDHSTQGYITSFTETDPTVASHVKNIASSDITDWTAGYDDSISAISVVNNVVNGVNQKTITLTRRSGSNPISATFTDIAQTGSGGVTDTNDFVTSASLLNGTLTLSIPNQNNVTVSGFSQLTSFSATNNSTATGDGSLAYNSNTGEFIYTPADFSGDFLSLNGGTIDGDLTVTGIINVNSETGTSNFKNDVSVDGDLSVDGALTVGTITADVRGDVYSIVGNTASTKVLESGAGSTPTAYFIGDLTTGAGDANMIFDTSLSMFRNHDVKIGDYNNSLGNGAENLNLYLGATSSIFFGTGTAQKVISATFISDLNFTIFSTITGTSFTNGVLTLRTKGADENEPGYSNYTENLQTYFDGRYVELAGDQMTGNLSFSTESIGVVGNIFNTNGTKILENGSDSSEAWYKGRLIGDITDASLNLIFDSSEGSMHKDLFMYKDSDEEYDIVLGYTAQIDFTNDRSSAQAPIETLTAAKISTWDSNVITSTYYDLVNTNVDGEGEIQIRIVKDNDPNSYITTSNNITGGTYINITSSENPGTETDGHDSNDPIVLDVDTDALDALYVNIDGDTMTGNLSFSTESIGLVGNIFNTNGTKILENGSNTQTAYLVGNVAGDIIESDLTTVIFDSSEDAFTRDINIGVPGTNGIISDNFDIDLGVTSQIYFGRGISLQEEYIDASKISQWDSSNEKHITNMEFQEGGTGNEGKFELYLTAEDSNQNRTTDWLIEEGANITMSITERVNGSGQGAINISADTSSPNGLATKTYVTSALNNVVTGIALDNGSGVVDNATNGDFTFIPGSGISILRGGTNTNDLTFAFDNSSLGFINQTNGDARYIRQTGTGFDPAQNGIMLKTGANTYSVTVNNSSDWDTAFGWGNHGTQGYLTSEVNDLTSSVTWANVPNANITEASVTQHQTALSITESQVSDLGNYVPLASGVTPTNGHVATYNASNELISSSITGILPTTTVFTSGSPDFGSNTITAGNFILSSDRDLKENIIPLAEREIKVDFKEYNFKGSDRTRFGVIAQELEENHPEFVHTRESGDKSVAYIDLLVAKVHELENRIKELENGARNG